MNHNHINEMNNFSHSLEIFNDDRANRIFDLFPSMQGQITVSDIKPFQFSGWHMHTIQTDYFCVVRGMLNLYLINELGKVNIFKLDSITPRTITVPKKNIHSWQSFSEGAILIYYLTEKHNESDEYRFTNEYIKNQYNFSHK